MRLFQVIHRLEFFRRQMEKVDKQVFTARRANDLGFRVFRDDIRNSARMVRFGMIGDNIVQPLDASKSRLFSNISGILRSIESINAVFSLPLMR